MTEINPFARQQAGQLGQVTEHFEARARATRAAFSSDAARAWLLKRHDEEMARPSYLPGMTFDQAAYQEGAKKVWRDLVAIVFPKTPPEA
jgi:hypothetical protein